MIHANKTTLHKLPTVVLNDLTAQGIEVDIVHYFWRGAVLTVVIHEVAAYILIARRAFCKHKIIEVLCTIIMGIMVVAVCWQVFTRFVLKNPSTVTEEMLRYLLVWTTMVGAAYAYGRRKHLSIGILTKKLSHGAESA